MYHMQWWTFSHELTLNTKLYLFIRTVITSPHFGGTVVSARFTAYKLVINFTQFNLISSVHNIKSPDISIFLNAHLLRKKDK